MTSNVTMHRQVCTSCSPNSASMLFVRQSFVHRQERLATFQKEASCVADTFIISPA